MLRQSIAEEKHLDMIPPWSLSPVASPYTFPKPKRGDRSSFYNFPILLNKHFQNFLSMTK